MHRHAALVPTACAAALLSLSACSGGSGGASASPTPAAAPLPTALPADSKTPVTFSFTDVAVASAGANTIRLGFGIKNASADPQLCDPSEFYIQLDDGTRIAADGSADNSCDPGTVDPKGSGTATMFFDLPSSYSGGITLFMVVNDAVVGQGTTSVK